MGFITKLKSALVNSNTSKTAGASDSIDAIIKAVDNKPLAISDNNVLYAGLNELGGYYVFQTVIVGALNVKTKKGAQLVISGKGFNFDLESDSVEFESESAGVKGRYVTKIDFQIEKRDASKIAPLKIEALTLRCKQHEILFTGVTGTP
jgi:hypothetical protein